MAFLVCLLVTAGLIFSAPISSVTISEQSYYTPPAIVAQETEEFNETVPDRAPETIQESTAREIPQEAPETSPEAPQEDPAVYPVIIPDIGPAEEPSKADQSEYESMLAAAIAAWEQGQLAGGIPGQGDGMIQGEEEDEVRMPGDPVPVLDRRVIVLGDSRTVGLYCSQLYDEYGYLANCWDPISPSYISAVGNTIFVAKAGEGGYWLQGVGAPIAERMIDENTAIVVWFGVNDLNLGLEDIYVDVINYLKRNYNVPVYFMEVGPCDGKSDGRNIPIKNFNFSVMSRLDPDVDIIYLNSELEYTGFSTLDGLHYDYATSWYIYQYMMSIVQYNN